MIFIGLIVFGCAAGSLYHDSTVGCLVIGGGMIVMGLIKLLVNAKR